MHCIRKNSFRRRRSKCNKKFNKYKILKRINPGEYGLLNIYDCPGFSLDGTEIENLISLINEKFTLFKKKMIIYMLFYILHIMNIIGL